MRSLLIATLTLALSGCAWFSEPLPEPATDNGLAGAETNYDRIADKIDSRVAAAITVAKDNAKDEKTVTGELAIAQAMLDAPKPDDLAWAKARAEKGDDKFYAEQLLQARQLAAAMIEANKRYEEEKARKDAEYKAGIKKAEMMLAAAEKSKINSWFLIGGGALTFIGVILVVVGTLPILKKLGASFLILGAAIGSVPFISEEPWFKKAIGWTIGIIIMFILAWLFMSRKKPECPTNNVSEPNK